MAKWGEGDPRWIVEERADATNVNNWHWTERDVTKWSEDLLRQLLLDVRATSVDGTCEVTEVTRVQGEASCNNRKGKLIFFYEWDLELAWQATGSAMGTKYSGIVKIPNLSEENDIDEIEVVVSLKKDEADTPLLEVMRTAGVDGIKHALVTYVRTLKSEFTQGMILPAKNGITRQMPDATLPIGHDEQQKDACARRPSQEVGVRIPTCSVVLMETFPTCAEELYRTFTSQELVSLFTNAPALVEPEKGGRIRMLNGNVSGEFCELVENERIVMKWRCKTWPEEHYADVTLRLRKADGGNTELRLDCLHVPLRHEEATRHDWQRHYFHRIRQAFGWVASPPPL
ncbi:activator of 90 kDa heat shock protein ATPase homolog 1-like isoform X1 [Lampetra fluviatilis]